MDIILSGYGQQPTNTITKLKIDEDITITQWSDSIDNPSFVCEGDGYLFTVTEADTFAYVYLYEKVEVGFQLLDQRKIDGGALCHIAFSSKNKALFGACYNSGTLFSIRVEDGKFGELLHHEVQQGQNVRELSRAHCVLLNRDETQLAVINIALDKIFFYMIKDGKLQHYFNLNTPKGSGPRHAIYSGNEELLYIITEYSNEIFIYQNKEGGQLLQRISTLAPTFQGNSNCSTLCWGKAGNYLYAANRGADTITQFSVRSDGTLAWLNEFPCGGKHPRHMKITDDGRYLIVCNQHSNNVAMLELDSDNGRVMGIYRYIDFPAPSGVLQWETN